MYVIVFVSPPSAFILAQVLLEEEKNKINEFNFFFCVVVAVVVVSRFDTIIADCDFSRV